jgi:hypothetical protein
MNLESKRPRGRPRNRRQDEVRVDGRIVGGEEWLEKVYNRGMEEAPANSKESSHSAHANGMNERIINYMYNFTRVLGLYIKYSKKYTNNNKKDLYKVQFTT